MPRLGRTRQAFDTRQYRIAIARKVLFGDGALPQTLPALRDRLGSTRGGAALDVERVFLVAEGGQDRGASRRTR